MTIGKGYDFVVEVADPHIWDSEASDPGPWFSWDRFPGETASDLLERWPA